MKRLKGTLLVLVLVSTMLMSFAIVGVRSSPTNGPKMDYLHIINYTNPDEEFAALDAGEIDITDWPLTAYWINQWVAEGRIPNEISLGPYEAIDAFEYGINIQEWPTGCEGMSVREGYTGTFTRGAYTWNQFHTRQRPETSVGMEPPPYIGNGSDYDPETESWKVYYDPQCLWCAMAWGLRLAIAFTTDKDYIVSTILEGLGEKMITWAAMPTHAGFLDIANLTSSSFVYHGPEGDILIPSLIMDQNLTRAAQLLDAAGFKDWDGNGTRNDPLKVAGPDNTYGTGDDVKTSASDLSDLTFYIRLDDPNRRDAGLKLKEDLEARNISMKILYNTHLYTGGWVLSPDPDYLYHLFHSSMHWALGWRWSPNYPGFCNELFDNYAEDVEYGTTLTEILNGFHNATFLLNKYVASIPLWSTASAKAYRTGWEGTVNMEGESIDNYWSFFNMRKTGTNTINWGFKSSPKDLNVITGGWKWDRKVLGLVYESLITRNPYNLAEVRGMLATSWSTGTWDGGKVYVDFTLKSGVKFHNGKTLTAEDVKWSMEFMRDCGSGVAWAHPVMNGGTYLDTSNPRNIYSVTVLTPGEGGNIRVYFNSGSYWALHWAGFIEILNPQIWQAADQALHWGYNPATHQFTGPGKDNVYGTEDDGAMSVREYHPHIHDYYPGGIGDGIKDLSQDGTGPWVFLSPGPDPPLSQYIDLVAFRPGIPETPWQTSQHHMSQSEVEQYLNEAFHRLGNVNYPGSVYETEYINMGMGIDRSIDVVPDILLIEWAAGTTSLNTAGVSPDRWNVDADINGDNKVTGADYGIANFNLLKTAG